MSKYQIMMIYSDETTDLQDEVFDDEDEAIDYAVYLAGCSRTGAEILNMSNPGDYPYDPDTFEEPTFEIIELEDDE